MHSHDLRHRDGDFNGRRECRAMSMAGDLFKGYETVRHLDKVAKLTAAGLTAHDAGFKRIWHEKAMELSATHDLKYSFRKNLDEREKLPI
jgi:hypothetical protein